MMAGELTKHSSFFKEFLINNQLSSHSSFLNKKSNNNPFNLIENLHKHENHTSSRTKKDNKINNHKRHKTINTNKT